MFARFDENPAMTLRVIKETKRYGRTDGRTDGQRENSIPPTNKVCGGYNKDIQVQIQRGGQGVRTLPGKSQVIWVSTGKKQLDPPGKCWTPSGTLTMIDFLEIDHLTSVK